MDFHWNALDDDWDNNDFPKTLELTNPLKPTTNPSHWITPKAEWSTLRTLTHTNRNVYNFDRRMLGNSHCHGSKVHRPTHQPTSPNPQCAAVSSTCSNAVSLKKATRWYYRSRSLHNCLEMQHVRVSTRRTLRGILNVLGEVPFLLLRSLRHPLPSLRMESTYGGRRL